MKKPLFIIIVVLLFALSSLPSAPMVYAQSCSPISSTYSGGTWHYLSFGSEYPNPPNTYGPWWRAGNYINYEVSISSATVAPQLDWFNTSDVFVGTLHTFSYADTPYTITVNTGAINIISTASFTGYVCLDYIGTATPVPPTATPTNTPVPPTNTPVPPTATNTPEVVVTATPVPPTATPTIGTEVYLSNIQALQETNFKWGLFAGVVLIGLVALVFVRVR